MIICKLHQVGELKKIVPKGTRQITLTYEVPDAKAKFAFLMLDEQHSVLVEPVDLDPMTIYIEVSPLLYGIDFLDMHGESGVIEAFGPDVTIGSAAGKRFLIGSCAKLRPSNYVPAKTGRKKKVDQKYQKRLQHQRSHPGCQVVLFTLVFFCVQFLMAVLRTDMLLFLVVMTVVSFFAGAMAGTFLKKARSGGSEALGTGE